MYIQNWEHKKARCHSEFKQSDFFVDVIVNIMIYRKVKAEHFFPFHVLNMPFNYILFRIKLIFNICTVFNWFRTPYPMFGTGWKKGKVDFSCRLKFFLKFKTSRAFRSIVYFLISCERKEFQLKAEPLFESEFGNVIY